MPSHLKCSANFVLVLMQSYFAPYEAQNIVQIAFD